MSPVVDGHLAEVSQPHHHMRGADAYFMIATWAAVGLEGAGRGYRAHLVVVSVRPDLDPTRSRQRRMNVLPTR